MKLFNPGDRIRFLNQVGEGTIIRQDKDVCTIEDTNGFEYQVNVSDIVLVTNDVFEERRLINSTLYQNLKDQKSMSKDFSSIKTGGKNIQILEVDLHQKKLSPLSKQLTSAEIHEMQTQTILSTLENEKKHHGKIIVFIHGKGNGILRKELISELKRRSSEFRYEDAPYHKYGIDGAIKVVVK